MQQESINRMVPKASENPLQHFTNCYYTKVKTAFKSIEVQFCG